MAIQVARYLLLSLILSFIPIPQFLLWLWPNWVVLFFVWLSYFRPKFPILIMIWGTGLVLDLLQSTYLGTHVIGLALLNLFLNQYKSKFLIYPYTQQIMIVFVACLVYLFSTQYPYVNITFGSFLTYAGLASVVTACIWPWFEMYSKSYVLALGKSKFKGDIYGV